MRMSLRIASAMPVSAKMLVLAVLCAVTSDSLAQQLNSPIRSEGRPELAAEVCLPQAPDFRERCVPGEILMKFKKHQTALNKHIKNCFTHCFGS